MNLTKALLVCAIVATAGAIGLASRVIHDRLADTDRVPGYDWLSRSHNPNPLQREAENEERVREFAEVLLRRRGILDTAATPLIEETLLAALRLHLHQRVAVPLTGLELLLYW